MTNHSTKKTCGLICAKKLSYLRKKKCDLAHIQQRKISRIKLETNNPNYKAKRKLYFATHTKSKSKYCGKVICPKCHSEGYQYIITHTLTANNGKQSQYSYLIVSHRHNANGKTILDKTCSIQKLD